MNTSREHKDLSMFGPLDLQANSSSPHGTIQDRHKGEQMEFLGKKNRPSVSTALVLSEECSISLLCTLALHQELLHTKLASRIVVLSLPVKYS